MTVQVVTDSGADIPEQLATDLGIVVVPLTVSFGDESYKDGVELSADQFYQRLLQGNMMPITSQPSVGSFVEAYKNLEGSSNQILSIHLSSKLSGTLNSAIQAGGMEDLGESIQFIDSMQASMGLGFSVIAAAEAAKGGASLAEAAFVARSVLDRTRLFILFDTLEYLQRGGRIGRASALLGSVLQIKPILTLEDGEIATKLRIRTFQKGMQRLQQLTEECGNLEKAAILYTTDPSAARNLADRLNNRFVGDSDPLIVRISPAVGAHGGPGVIGVVCVITET
jgi:DegV family protein with EDD domain